MRYYLFAAGVPVVVIPVRLAHLAFLVNLILDFAASLSNQHHWGTRVALERFDACRQVFNILD